MSWSQSTSVLVVAALLMLGGTPSRAQDVPAKEAAPSGMSGGCEAFKWPLDKERSAFDSAQLEKVASGAARGPLADQSFALALAPAADVSYALPPSHRRKKSADGAQFGGLVAFAAPATAGVYQVTLSTEGWVDLVENGTSLDSLDHSGSKGCPGLRKSVRFKLDGGPVVLQISDAPADTIKIGIRRVE
jgi:hypothetical protein